MYVYNTYVHFLHSMTLDNDFNRALLNKDREAANSVRAQQCHSALLHVLGIIQIVEPLDHCIIFAVLLTSAFQHWNYI